MIKTFCLVAGLQSNDFSVPTCSDGPARLEAQGQSHHHPQPHPHPHHLDLGGDLLNYLNDARCL